MEEVKSGVRRLEAFIISFRKGSRFAKDGCSHLRQFSLFSICFVILKRVCVGGCTMGRRGRIVLLYILSIGMRQ